ncbi:DUF945 family protein [Umboniibacter marinipuniceus]|uniref:Uncharacterized protein DUF945 n=1 Tax=Umboniibacter marinipuniceus TaxID=569599 RepID=A0A3M0AEZ4_9GAMM|nr:DUF945 family protein [Umboniibacter marinipuniceus]RMA82734.1 uncharacterized protein DUF945 [Umboniibacter marinipuniceus]
MKKLLALSLGIFVSVGVIYSANSFIAELVAEQMTSLVNQHNVTAHANGDPHRLQAQRTDQFFGAHYRFSLYHEDGKASLIQCFTGEASIRHTPLDWVQLTAASARIEINFEDTNNCPAFAEDTIEQQLLDLFGNQLIVGKLSLGFRQTLSGELSTPGVNFVEDNIALTFAPIHYLFAIEQQGFEQHQLNWSGFEFLDHRTRASAYAKGIHYQSSLSFNGRLLTEAHSQLTSGDIWYSDGQRRSGLSTFNSDFSGVVSNGFMHGTGLVHADGLMLNNLPLGNFTEALKLADFPYQSFQTLALYDGQLAPTDWQSQMLETLAGTQLYIETLSLEQGSAKLNAMGEIKLVTTPENPLELHLDVAINEAFIKHLADIQTITSQSFITPSSAAFETESARARRQLEQLFEQYAEAGFLNRDGSQGYESPLSLQAGSLLLNGIPLAPAGN